MALGVLGRIVKFEVILPVSHQLGALFENGEVFLAPVFLEVLEGGAGLGENYQPSVEMVVALPQAANSALAVIEDF